MIAMAMSCQPSLIIADEPTTALDVTVQALVLNELAELQESSKMAMLLITHDMGVIAETCRNVIVMYCGNVIEIAKVKTLFKSPKHPYTFGLLNSMPKIRQSRVGKLPTIKGIVPDLLHLPKGCNFANRCPKVKQICLEKEPELESCSEDSQVSCFFPNE